MKLADRSSQPMRLLVLALALCTLAGCDTLNSWFSNDRVDYKDAGTAPNLSVPPDLDETKLTPGHYVAPATTAGLGSLPTRSVTPAGNLTEGVPSVHDAYGMHIERDGDRRWLVVDGRSPDQLWPQLIEFWEQSGFVLTTASAQTGIMETDWAENRANIPNDWFRRTVGKLIDFAYSSGTRDRFRTLVERGPNGSTDVFVTHRGMEEQLIGRDSETSRWVDTPRNPQLEIAFLQNLMQKFGLTEAQSKQLIANARPATATAEMVAAAGAPMLDLDEPFDRAWLRVGLALDRTNFTVDDRDRAKGLYYVRYSDPNLEMQSKGLFSKLFNKTPERRVGSQYLVNVKPDGDRVTQVAVVDANGQADGSPAAQQIVSLLHAQLN
jgi:outer membrane protein assembly factor BamC